MDEKNTHSVTKTEISVFGRQALDAERRRSPSLADKVLMCSSFILLPWPYHFIRISVIFLDACNMVYTTLKVRASRLPSKAITYRDYKCFQEDLYIEDVNRIPVTACQIFDDPTDNYWAL